ncbi:uncharacterized protein LOC122971377 isoform X3 [Thunnus albacares]|uniref:uncharacterized protein LOC122971377 isoform X3 n=1 Tax=Thunnus albacares TaxID=8236 RepID=UPI001CF63D0E|nr:uncharacterized protein LOC122971377 isoform X3 [Thunnus albacares]
MDTDFILKQVQHMGLPSFSVREQNHYRAEKMLMRQFMLLKQQYQVPIYLSVKEMKSWLMAGRSFLDEFQEIAEGTEARKLLMAELAWTSSRRLCLNQMEQELLEELEEEKRLSLQLRRRVTLEGLQMFLSIFLPKAEKDVQTFLRHLSNKLLISFTGCHSSRRSKLALFTKLQRTTAPLVSVVMETALRFLLDKPEPHAEVKPSQTWDPTWPGTWSKPFTKDLMTSPNPSTCWTLMKASSLLERASSVLSRTWTTECELLRTAGLCISWFLLQRCAVWLLQRGLIKMRTKRRGRECEPSSVECGKRSFMYPLRSESHQLLSLQYILNTINHTYLINYVL